MAGENENVALLERLYRRWNDSRGASIEDWLEHIDPCVEWRSLAEGSEGLEFTAQCEGVERVRAYFESLTGVLEMVHYTVDDFVAQGDRVVAICRTGWRNPRTDKSFDTPKLDVFGFRDGRIVSFFELYDTAMVSAAMADG